jgi:hypothetical protein
LDVLKQLRGVGISRVALEQRTQGKLRAGRDAALDRQIDKLVYELYGLTEAEIAIVEGAKP